MLTAQEVITCLFMQFFPSYKSRNLRPVTQYIGFCLVLSNKNIAFLLVLSIIGPSELYAVPVAASITIKVVILINCPFVMC